MKQIRIDSAMGLIALSGVLIAGCSTAPERDGGRLQVSQVGGDSCRPGSFAAIESARMPPSARPGDPAIYRDCHR